MDPGGCSPRAETAATAPSPPAGRVLRDHLHHPLEDMIMSSTSGADVPLRMFRSIRSCLSGRWLRWRSRRSVACGSRLMDCLRAGAGGRETSGAAGSASNCDQRWCVRLGVENVHMAVVYYLGVWSQIWLFTEGGGSPTQEWGGGSNRIYGAAQPEAPLCGRARSLIIVLAATVWRAQAATGARNLHNVLGMRPSRHSKRGT